MAATTISGGTTHGLAPLSHAEFQAAQKALEKLKNLGSSVISKFGNTAHGATVPSGSPLIETPTLVHGQGSDTFVGGVRSASFAAAPTAGNDTVVGGSKTVHTVQLQHAALNSDTINVAGVTAANVKLDEAASKQGHTISVGKTSVTISGLSSHDISKLHH